MSTDPDAVIRNAHRVLDARQYPPDEVWTDLLAVAEEQRIRLAKARFAPLGDNHHNAAVCPYCSPGGATLGARLRTAEARLEAVRADLDLFEGQGATILGIARIRAALSAAPQPEPETLQGALGLSDEQMAESRAKLLATFAKVSDAEHRAMWEARWPLPEPPASDETARTPDLMAALRASVEAAKKRRTASDEPARCRAQGEGGTHGQTYECSWPKGHPESIHSWQVCGHTAAEGCIGHGDF